MRAVIYARYSSENQRQASIEDQIEVCKRLIKKEGWTVAGVYQDAAISGASRFRPGYQKLLLELHNGVFDVVVVEALDRLGRKLADVADLHDRCAFAGVKLFAVNVGEIGAMHIGMLGTMAQLYLSDLREKTWRGQLGRALQGKLPGGKAYGYDVVVPRDANAGAGERLINPAEAAIVRRIFEEFAAGHSPRAIAKHLNKERVRGPGGRPWGDTTIRGQAARGNGILNNALYAGRLEWNRCGYMKDPRTGKRVARPNPREKWEVIPVSKLRIVDDKLWNRVKARQKTLRVAMSRQTSGNALNRAHRRRYLLSGLLVCGLCGGGYTIVGQDRYGCANHRSKGTCSNALAINRKELEERVLSALRERLLAPELVADFVGAFNAEVKRIASEADGEREHARRTVSDTERKIAAVIKAIEDGAYNTALKERLAALETEKATAATVLTGAKPPLVVRLHPNLPALYRKKVERLAEALDRPETAAEAGEIIRTLIERIVFSPQGNSLTAQLFGDFVKLANFAESADMKNKNAGSRRNPALLSVVAGERNPLFRTVLQYGS